MIGQNVYQSYMLIRNPHSLTPSEIPFGILRMDHEEPAILDLKVPITFFREFLGY